MNSVDNLISLCIKTTTTPLGLGPPCCLAVSLARSWPGSCIHGPPVRACSGTKIALLQGSCFRQQKPRTSSGHQAKARSGAGLFLPCVPSGLETCRGVLGGVLAQGD